MQSDRRTPYTIVVQGHLTDRWIDWFGGIRLSRDFQAARDPVTIIGGAFDQAELHGIIAQLRDLGISLLSIDRQLDHGGPERSQESINKNGKGHGDDD